MDSLLIGQGPDTFFAEFPQGDLLGKLYAYGTTQMVVDKPHNLYLQIGINEGGIALLAFLVMMVAYLIDSFRLYALRREYDKQQIAGAAVTLAIIGYLGAALLQRLDCISSAHLLGIVWGRRSGQPTEPQADTDRSIRRKFMNSFDKPS